MSTSDLLHVPTSGRREPALFLSVLIAVVGAIYFFTFHFERSFDDTAFYPEAEDDTALGLSDVLRTDYWGIAKNPAHVENSPYYRPLSQIVIVLERRMFRNHIAAIRAAHTILHLLNILLVYLAAVEFLRKENLSFSAVRRASVVAAAWFALLPITADAVLFLASVCDLLAFLFSVPALVFFHRYLHHPNKFSLIVSLFSCAAAMLSKETGFVLPIIFAAMTLGKRSAASSGQKSIGLFLSMLVAALLLVLRFAVVGRNAQGSLLSIFPNIFAFYAVALRYTLIPYPMQIEIDISEPSFFTMSVGIAAVVMLLFTLFRFLKNVRLAFFGLPVWAVFVLPSSFAAASQGVFAPRYLYLPALGAALTAAQIAAWLMMHRRGGLLLVPLLLLLCVGTVSRAVTWMDGLTLWAVEIGRNPESVTAHINLSNVLAERGRFSEAVAVADKAAALAKKKHQPCAAAMALINAATVLSEYLHRDDAALSHLAEAASLCPSLADE